MEFFTLGDRAKPSLLILHGWGLSGDKYRYLAQILSKDFFVMVLDLPGFGKTSVPESAYSVDDYAEKIKTFLEEQHISKVLLLGHSFGGRIAIKFSLLAPAMVSALILSGTPGVEQFSVKRSLKRMVFWCAAKTLKIFSFIPSVNRLRARFYEKRDFGKLEGVMKETFLKVVRENLTPDVKKILQPTLLLWGSRDQMTPLMDAEKMMRLMPTSQLKIFAKVGHMLPYEKPYEFVREVLSFALAHHIIR